ncbi:MAG: HAMP domain-containing sensor histidine kinase [Sulfurimonas sp.]|nr:HAMP domain-containing sensor histidine kinase [Sulfurimonas sp.]
MSRFELQETIVQLNSHKKNLENEIEKERQKSLSHENLLLYQSRKATMGEMLESVAHQWIQPLNVIGMYMQMIAFDLIDGKVDDTYLSNVVEAVNRQTNHMENTLYEFKNFLHPKLGSETFDLNTMVQKSLSLVKDEFMKYKIKVVFEKSKPTMIQGSLNQIQHVLINLLNNSKEAFLNAVIEKKRMIEIKIEQSDSLVILKFQDNAGGIDESIISDIFKPSTSTKKSKSNSGLGLYICSLIMQKYEASIDIKNINHGALFTLTFNKGE